jgi:hypothetical protein
MLIRYAAKDSPAKLQDQFASLITGGDSAAVWPALRVGAL